MHEEIIFAGFGGQGIMFVGQLLAYTALDESKHVTWIPSYGPEMRGGTANCTVVMSDEPIGSPVCKHPSIALAFNNPSLEKYEPLVMAGGLLVINSSMTVRGALRTDINVIALPATATASEVGEVRATNMVMLGALLACRPLVGTDTIRHVLTEKLGSRKAHLLQTNLTAFERGAALAQIQPANV
jgi:2-oxoglutarate ferredoxin oxidoreductase subunit gamma